MVRDHTDTDHARDVHSPVPPAGLAITDEGEGESRGERRSRGRIAYAMGEV